MGKFDKAKIEILRVIGEGNYLGKARRNFYISNRCWDLMHQLSLEFGINHSNVIEIAVRELYQRTYGSVPRIPLRARQRDDYE